MYFHKRELPGGERSCNAKFNITRCPACGTVVGFFYDEPVPFRTPEPRVFCSKECVEAVPCPFELYMSLRGDSDV